MSVYTTTLREIIKDQNDYVPAPVPELIEKYRSVLFDFDYPTPKEMNSEDFKRWFETQFFARFMMWEIGFNTLEEFKMQVWHYCSVYLPIYCKKLDDFLRITDKELLNQWNSVTVTDGEDTRYTTRDNNDLNVESTLPANLINAGTIKDTRYADRANRNEGKRVDDSKGTEDRVVTETRTNGSLIDRLILYYDLFDEFYEELFAKFNKLFFGILL